LKKKFIQRQLLAFTANMQTSLIGQEACSGALSGPCVAATRARCPIDRGAVREAFREVQQEELFVLQFL
jgi:hypothetical protein